MKLRSTLFLKAVIILIGSPVLAICTIGFPWFLINLANPDYAHMLYPIVIIMYSSAIPFFGALYQAFRLLNYINENNAFTNISVVALKKIKRCAISVSFLYVLGSPFFFLLGEKDDAPGIVLINLIIIFASIVIAVFAAVLQKLLHVAIEIKTENDSIV
ncbi:DUF2975 domain-containing protein [Bacillus bombysepticus]|uniref:DUF2975 domain-containing protein n=1 Tax=Bacillus bombysepticus TaxID=658666 RepID=UPI00301AEC9E